MKLYLQREPSSIRSTLGKLYLNGQFECYTLEDVVREKKIKGETAIPAGTYKLTITHSQRFGREMPLLLEVPNFEGVRIHSGNTDADTHGCILVGLLRSTDTVYKSRKAYDALYLKLRRAFDSEEAIELEIANATP